MLAGAVVFRCTPSYCTKPLYRNELGPFGRGGRDSGTSFAKGKCASSPRTPGINEKGQGDVRTTPRAERHHRSGREPAESVAAHDLQPDSRGQAADDSHHRRFPTRAPVVAGRQPEVDGHQGRRYTRGRFAGIVIVIPRKFS